MASRPLRRALVQALTHAARATLGPDATALDFVVAWITAGRSMRALAAAISVDLARPLSRGYVSFTCHRLAPDARVRIAAAREVDKARRRSSGTTDVRPRTDPFGAAAPADATLARPPPSRRAIRVPSAVRQPRHRRCATLELEHDQSVDGVSHRAPTLASTTPVARNPARRHSGGVMPENLNVSTYAIPGLAHERHLSFDLAPLRDHDADVTSARPLPVGIADDPHTLFEQLFSGRRSGFGESRGSSTTTSRSALGAEHYQQHLASDGSDAAWSLGLVPVCEDGTVRFGALDFDAKGLPEEDAQRVLRRAAELQLPLRWTRSRSDGLHGWLFLKGPAPAAIVRRLLTAWGYALEWNMKAAGSSKDRGDRFFEVFPKQDSIAADKVGNWIRLPWPGGDRARGRRGVWLNSDAPSFPAWIANAFANRVSSAQLDALVHAFVREPLPTPTVAPRVQGTTAAINSALSSAQTSFDDMVDMTIAEAAALILDLAPDRRDDYDRWLRVLMALHSQFAGTADEDAALELAIRWSSRSSKYQPGDVDAKWQSFGRHAGSDITGLSLRHWADEDRALAPIRELNEQYASLLQGGAGILWTPASAEPDFLDPRRWKEFFGNRTLTVGGKLRPLPDVWLKHPQRRSYNTVVFNPSAPPLTGIASARGPAGSLDFNLWPGFALTPTAEGSCDRFLAHLREIVCAGDDTLYAWVLQYLAHVVQAPTRLAGTALALRGPQGSGKSLVGEVLGVILGSRLYTKVSRPDELTGRFNGHHQGRLLIQVEEGFWAGDKKAEGALKHMVTSETIRVERKFMDPIELPNYGRLLITSNSNWVVPAGAGERRFAVLDVSGERASDFEYFAAMRRQLFEEGGCARLFHVLLHDVVVDWDLLRRPPKTAALLEQQLESLAPEDRWLLDLLTAGVLPGDCNAEGATRTESLQAGFRAAMLSAGRTWVTDERLGRLLTERFGDAVERVRPREGDTRPRCYRFAPLARCREKFAERLALAPDWGDVELWQRADALTALAT